MVTLTPEGIKRAQLKEFRRILNSYRDFDYYSCGRCGNLFNETNLGSFPEFVLWCQNCRQPEKPFEKRTLSGGNDGCS